MEEKDTNKKKKKNDKENELIVELNNKIKELESKLLYKDADLINYRKRKDEEVSNMLKYSNLDMASELLIVVDDLERAIKIDDDVLDDELSKFLSGFKMIYTRLINILNNFEIKEIEALGKEFDPRYHQAVLTDNVSDKGNNIILDVIEQSYGKGYIQMSEEVFEQVDILKKFNYENIYKKALNKSQEKYIKTMFNKLYDLYLLALQKEEKVISIYDNFLLKMSDEYIKNTTNEEKVLDYIAMMTDTSLEKEYLKYYS